MARKKFQILPLTQLKRSAGRAILGRVEYAGTRFIITDYGAAVAMLGPLSKSAEMFMTRSNGGEGEEDPALDLTPGSGRAQTGNALSQPR